MLLHLLWALGALATLTRTGSGRVQLSTTVPVLTTGGIAKRYMAPGWRLGWVLVHDRQGLFAHVRTGLVRLAQIVLGANSLVQAALPALLEATPASYYAECNKQLEVRWRGAIRPPVCVCA
jgi:tyrosine aminotransferase